MVQHVHMHVVAAAAELSGLPKPTYGVGWQVQQRVPHIPQKAMLDGGAHSSWFSAPVAVSLAIAVHKRLCCNDSLLMTRQGDLHHS
jgi:hypothetical protein